MQIHKDQQMQHTAINRLQRSACDSCTFEPGILKREGGHYYENICGTLRANAGDNQMAVAYRTHSFRTDDLSDTHIEVLAVFEGNGCRPSHKGLGISKSDKMYTLNSTEVHGVIYEVESDTLVLEKHHDIKSVGYTKGTRHDLPKEIRNIDGK